MKTLIGILAALALEVSAFAQQLTDDQVRLAIARGSGKPHQIGLTLNDKQTAFFSTLACRTCGQSGYTITVYNPGQWVELCAAQAKKEMQPFSVADVTDQMRAQELHVVALPSRAEYLTGNGIGLSSSVHRVVLNDTARQTTIQPLAVRQDTLQSNSALRSFEYTMASADFSLSDVAGLRDSDPKGEFFIVVVGDNKNKFFKVKSRDLKLLFPKEGDGRNAVPDRPTPAPAASVMPVTAPSATGVRLETVTAAQPTAAASPAAPATAPTPAGGAKVEIVPAIQSPSTTAVAGATATVTTTGNGGGRLGDVAANASNPARTTGEATAEISSDPLGAAIEIDGNFIGSTPSSVGIATGGHILRISKNGYKRWERAFSSSTGNIKVAAVLEPIPVDAAGTAHATGEIRQDTNPFLGSDPPPSVSGTAVSSAGLAEEALIGVWFTGNPTVRHDGVEISGVQARGPADNIDIKPGDVIIAIDGHFLYTIDELRAELLKHEPGARLRIRYRHYRLTSENYLIIGSKDPVPLR